MIKKEYIILAENLKFPEGPIYMNDGSIILVEIARGTLSKVTSDGNVEVIANLGCLLYTSPSPRDPKTSRLPSSA